MSELISSGIAECIFEPRGDAGLEGYELGRTYKFERCRRDSVKASRAGYYYRVWPTDGDYYECCGPNQFKTFFKVKEELKIYK